MLLETKYNNLKKRLEILNKRLWTVNDKFYTVDQVDKWLQENNFQPLPIDPKLEVYRDKLDKLTYKIKNKIKTIELFAETEYPKHKKEVVFVASCEANFHVIAGQYEGCGQRFQYNRVFKYKGYKKDWFEAKMQLIGILNAEQNKNKFIAATTKKALEYQKKHPELEYSSTNDKFWVVERPIDCITSLSYLLDPTCIDITNNVIINR